ncbi:MAG: 16S rRNA processing protein RimM [Lachnospiraceae bacterium]|nr:16S rRNA processing protein RimM [Lachnospiraceae bacterium]
MALVKGGPKLQAKIAERLYRAYFAEHVDVADHEVLVGIAKEMGLDEADNINDIEMYKHMDLYVTREDAVPLEEGEFYIADLIGLDVIDDTGKKIGVLKDVLQTGANDVYIVTGNENVGNKELMLPKIDECVRDINLEEKTITVHIMKGLLDL